MSISSMTGFARGSGTKDVYLWSWEIRSLNGRGLDIRCRLPSLLDSLEVSVRTMAARYLNRGNININLTLNRVHSENTLKINTQVLEQILQVTDQLKKRADVAPPTADGLLALRGVIEITATQDSVEELDMLQKPLLLCFEETIDLLVSNRRLEGQRLGAIIATHVDNIASLTKSAGLLAVLQPVTLRARLRKQVADIVDSSADLIPERVFQEAALLATKADVREELDRLIVHVEAARALLLDGGTIGRRLDFLAQEFNREANTLCAKTQDVALTKIGIELKTVIDQFREQAQNIE